MIINTTESMGTTHARTGICALVPYTGKFGRALLVDCAFRLALYIRISLKTWQTGTGCSEISIPAFSIDSTWRGTTRIDNFWFCRCCWKKEITSY
jgi:hypothetical protein